MRTAVLAIDQGTTNTKAVLVDRAGAVLARASAPVGISFPAPGRVEQDPERVWRSVLEAATRVLAGAPDVAPSALALTNQRESVLAWDGRTGRPLSPVIGWQDSRMPDRWPELAAHAGTVRRRTGLEPDPMFSAGKMRWLGDHLGPRIAREGGSLRFGTIDAWLVWRLTGGAVYACEAGNASRTLLFDLQALDWHPELLDLFGIARSALPEVRASDAGFGVTVDLGRLPAGVPVAAIMADSHAALFGHDCTAPGAAKATYGTGSSVMTPCSGPDTVPRAAARGIATTLAWRTTEPAYAHEANVLATGAALEWMAGVLGAGGVAELDRLAAGVADAAGAQFVPAFSGLGAPHWDRSAVGTICGVTAGTTAGHLARAAFDAVAHQIADVVAAIEAAGDTRVAALQADGGATTSPTLMQLQADVLGLPVHVADHPEISALGVARLAWSAVEGGDPGPPGVQVRTTHRPASTAQERQERRAAWRLAVARARGRAVGAADRD